MKNIFDNKGMSQMVMVIIGVVVLVGGALLYARMNSTVAPTKDDVMERNEDEDNDEVNEEGKQGSIPESDEENKQTVEEGSILEEKDVEITASNFKYDVTEIRVKKGQKIALELSAEEGMHDFTLDEFNVKTKQIKAGEKDDVEFVADKTGTFEYYCSVGNHRTMGMVGKLIVE